jgi:hypothetical protein
MANRCYIRIGMVVSRTTLGAVRTAYKYLQGRDYGTMYHAITLNHTYAKKRKVNDFAVLKLVSHRDTADAIRPLTDNFDPG